MGVLFGADGAAGELAPCETDGAAGAALAAGSAADVALGVGVLAEAEAGAGTAAGGCGLAEGAVRLV